MRKKPWQEPRLSWGVIVIWQPNTETSCKPFTFSFSFTSSLCMCKKRLYLHILYCVSVWYIETTFILIKNCVEDLFFLVISKSRVWRQKKHQRNSQIFDILNEYLLHKCYTSFKMSKIPLLHFASCSLMRS